MEKGMDGGDAGVGDDNVFCDIWMWGEGRRFCRHGFREIF